MAQYQVAWPFKSPYPGEIDEFIDRWAGWLAAAADGRLAQPRNMPECRPHGSWRRWYYGGSTDINPVPYEYLILLHEPEL